MIPDVSPEVAEASRIMVVEDEGLIAFDIERRLRAAGYEVVATVDTGRKAIEAAAATTPDLILMDIRLKGDLDGIETARLIHEKQDVPVVYLTAHTDQTTLQRAKITEPFAYLPKPVGPASLPTSIEVALWKHRTERQLRLQRAWLVTVLRNMADGVIVVNSNGAVQFMNPAAETLTGWMDETARGELLGSVLRLFAPDLDRFVDDPLPAALASGRSQALASGLQLVNQRGHHVPVEGEIAPSGDGRAVLGAVVSLRDVTARRIEEHELRQQQKLHAVGGLAAGVAHDFSNVLTVIGGCTHLLRDGLPDSSALLGLVDEISAATNRGAEVTRRMLAFSGMQAERPQMLNLNTMITEWQDFCRALVGPQNQLQFSLAPDLQDVFGPAGDLEEVLIKLLANARDALTEGGRIVISTTNVSLDQGETATRDYIALSVKDNGIGMDPQVAERIFEPFFSTRALGDGTGLGLFIVHRIVTDLGGSISVQTEPGKGTEFTAYLPAARQSRPVDLSEMRSAGGAGTGSRTVLLVDGDERSRSASRSELESRGYTVLESSDGISALAAARWYSGRIGVLVTDVRMAGINGFQLAQQLSRIAPDLKTVFLSQHRGDLLSPDLRPCGCRFVSKPVVLADLMKEIENLIRTSPELTAN